MSEINFIKSWTKNTWENSSSTDMKLQKQANTDIKELNASERKLLLNIISGNQSTVDEKVLKLHDKLQAMGKPNYESTRSNWFWSDISRSWKNWKNERTSSNLALNALNIHFTNEIASEKRINKADELANKVKGLKPESKKDLDSCVKEFNDLYKSGIPFEKAGELENLIIEKYKASYDKKTAEDRFIDASAHYNTNGNTPRRYPLE